MRVKKSINFYQKTFSLLLAVFAFTFIVGKGLSFQASAQEMLSSTESASMSAAPISTEAANYFVTGVNPETKQAIQDKKDQDITETVNKKTDTLATYIFEKNVNQFKGYNGLQYAIRGAISHGLSANIIVLILMFPLVASIIAFSRHVIGIRGFGIYTPAVLSVAFVSTGIPLGIIIFIFIILVASGLRILLKKISLPHLPKTALLLWGVSVSVLAFLIAAAALDVKILLQFSIFPLLIIILLSENFIESQLFNTQTEALKLTIETVLIATICAALISWDTFQKIVILNPELTLLGTAAIDILIGKFTGLRLVEYFRFQTLFDKK